MFSSIREFFTNIENMFDKNKQKNNDIKNSLVIERVLSDNIKLGISKTPMEMVDNECNTQTKKISHQSLLYNYNTNNMHKINKLYGLYSCTSYNNTLSYVFINYKDKNDYARLIITYIPPDIFTYEFTSYSLLDINKYVHNIGHHGMLQNYNPILSNSIELDKIYDFIQNKSNT
jgi:hypothetical protein